MAWLWGLLGAVWYASPVLVTCCLTNKKAAQSCWPCVAEAVIALTCGTIAAAAFVPYTAELMHQNSDKFVAALATGVGLAQKKIAPRLTDALTQLISAFVSKTPPTSGS